MGDRFKINTFNNIASRGLELFTRSKYDVGKHADPDAILLRSFNLHEETLGSGLKAVGRAGAGTNNIQVKALSQKGIPVFNTPGANANAVKELVIAAILMSARNVVPAANYVAGLSSAGDQLQSEIESAKKKFSGSELPGRTVGIVGLGKIGSLVASSCIKLGMKVVGYDPTITIDAAWGLSTEVVRAQSLDEVLSNSDFVTVHVPLADNTRNLMDAKTIVKIKKGATLLNFSRGGIVDTLAINEALAHEHLAGYVCDFPSEQFRKIPQIICLPHLGASTKEAEENCAVMVVSQVQDFLENGNILNSVNFPNVTMERESAFRVGISNQNVPNMVGQISTVLADNKLNIHNMVNKSMGNMAYTLVDTDSPVKVEVIKAISTVEGVLGVRYLPIIEN